MIGSVLKKKGEALCLSFFCFCYTGHAVGSAYLELGVSSHKVSYSESNSVSERLNKESGVLPGILVETGLAYKNLTLFAEAEFSQFSIDYIGKTQANQPLETTTDTTRAEYTLGAGYQITDWLGSTLSLSQYYWDREIEGTRSSLPLNEYYCWKTLKLGTEIRLFKRPIDRLSLKFAYGALFDESLEVDLSRLGFGRPLIQLRGDTYKSFGVRYARKWTPDLDINFDMNYTRVLFKQSDSVSASNSFTTISIREPRSKTGLVQLSLGLQYKI